MKTNFQAVAFDMDGVLRIGQKMIPNADKTIEHMVKKKIPGIICTNECRYSSEEIRDDLSEMGLNIPESWDIYTSAMAVRDYLKKKFLNNKNKKYIIGVIGEKGLYEAINELNKLSNFEFLDNPPENCNDNLILVIGSLNKIKINTLEKALLWIKAGAKIITTCNDLSDPSSKGNFHLGMPNQTLHLLKYNINIKKPYSVGKPNPIFYHKIKSFFNDKVENIKDENILFVGDTIYTDMQLAEESNFSSCMVLSGNTTKDTLKNYVIEPDIIIDTLENLIPFL